MLNKIISFALKNRIFVVCAALLISGAGFFIAKDMPIDVLPDLNRPTVVIMTEAHAMVPEDVEQLVTLPLEQILNGATGVENVMSTSGLGLSVIKVQFAWGTDIYRNRQIVMEKLPLAKSRLPAGIEPIMAPISSIMGQIQIIGINSKSGKHSPSDIRALADYQIKYDLLSIPGVSKVIIGGGSAKQLQAIIDAEKLRSFGVSILDVETAITKNNANSSGAFINLGTKAPAITVRGFIKSKEDLEKVVVKADDLRPVLLKDVATVQFGPSAIKIGEAGINGTPGVLMVIMKQPGYDTVKLTEQIEERLKMLSSSLDSDLEINTELFKQSIFIERAIDNVMEAVRDGGIMVVIILFIFLMNWRITFITLTAIPLSMALTVLVFSIFDVSINTMTLGGIAVAIGALVDDAIVDVENVFRRLKENHLKDISLRENALSVIFKASSEVRKPIVIGTLLVMVVYLPLFFLTGMEGKLFTPIGASYIISVLASLFVSLTVTPVLCYFLLPNSLSKSSDKETFVVRTLKVIVAKVIAVSIRRAKTVLVLLVIALGISIAFLLTRGTQFLPPFNEGVAQVNLVLPPDTGLDTSNAYGLRLEKLLTGINGIKNVTRRTGRSEGDEHAEGVNTSEIIISFDPKVERQPEDIIAEIRQEIDAEFPGVAYAIDQPLAHLLSAMLSGVKAQVAVKIFGPDLNILRSLAKDVEQVLKPVDGVKDLIVEPQVLIPNISIEPKRDSLALHSLSVDDVGKTVELSLGGETVSRFIQGQFTYPIILRLKEENRQSLDDIRNLYVRKDNGELIRLADLADVKQTLSSNNIKHENVGRRIIVQHNVAGRSLGEVVADVDVALESVRERIKGLKGYSLRISGQFEAQRKATKRILLLSIVSLLCMVLILYMHFKSINLSLQVMISIPMAFLGAVTYLAISKQTLSVATLVGLISLGGIAARNAILLLDHYIHLCRKEQIKFTPELIIQAGQERMVPVIMTALTSGIALIPLALAPGQPGKEILYPVATVIIGGLISSTILEFIVSPAAFWLFGKKAAEKTADPEKIDFDFK
ncbi:efflux RND transporter permease subunit [Lentisphaera profundi]|uniref:Efflux RND transporter permease subunit n=1 Tax=Lentisphaera profundi TaxID=1658616 RepID=A0ABY7VT08_9BACT|nr:efflux RND transporter permease subunit [Lentisphaera profundi]WDE95919.1 efflux RND transporter permease subunit [Lentisphaera profundi]